MQLFKLYLPNQILVELCHHINIPVFDSHFANPNILLLYYMHNGSVQPLVYESQQLKSIYCYVLCIFQKCKYDAFVLKMTSSQECADHRRMSTDVNNKTSLSTINNNPSSSPAVDCVQSSPMMRASFGTSGDSSATAVANRRSDFSDYRGGSGSDTSSPMTAGVTPSFRSPKLESQAASSGRTSAKKAQKLLHHSFPATSATGKWRHKTTSVSMSTTGGHSQASDSVRKYFFVAFV